MKPYEEKLYQMHTICSTAHTLAYLLSSLRYELNEEAIPKTCHTAIDAACNAIHQAAKEISKVIDNIR